VRKRNLFLAGRVAGKPAVASGEQVQESFRDSKHPSYGLVEMTSVRATECSKLSIPNLAGRVDIGHERYYLQAAGAPAPLI